MRTASRAFAVSCRPAGDEVAELTPTVQPYYTDLRSLYIPTVSLMTSEVLNVLKTRASPQQVISATPVTVGSNYKGNGSKSWLLVRTGHGVKGHDLKSRLVMRFDNTTRSENGERAEIPAT